MNNKLTRIGVTAQNWLLCDSTCLFNKKSKRAILRNSYTMGNPRERVEEMKISSPNREASVITIGQLIYQGEKGLNSGGLLDTLYESAIYLFIWAGHWLIFKARLRIKVQISTKTLMKGIIPYPMVNHKYLISSCGSDEVCPKHLSLLIVVILHVIILKCHSCLHRANFRWSYPVSWRSSERRGR